MPRSVVQVGLPHSAPLRSGCCLKTSFELKSMQNTKDSFYIALRDRLAALNPARVITIGGAVRPAIVATENEAATSALPSPDTFYIHWGGARELRDQALEELECEIRYVVEGSETAAYQDRGRALAKSDEELLAITYSATAPLKDYSVMPAIALGTNIFWTRPELGPIKVDGHKLLRTAKLRVFAFTEVPA
jgi:hypothetical protein